jgi:DNA-binding transcriptional LysR family regulator
MNSGGWVVTISARQSWHTRKKPNPQFIDMSVTLTRLRSFVVLARTGSFAKTAKAVGRSQPAITDQIRKLEEALGVKLFHRQTRAVRLTAEGEVLFHRTEGILRDLDNVLLDIERVASLEVGEVRVGATPTLACYIVPEIIGTFRRKYPGIRVVFSDQTAAELETQVETRQLDFYFGPRPSPKSNLRFQFVAADSYVIVVPKGHKLARRGCSDPHEIAKYPLLLMCRGTYVRDEIDHFFKKHRLKVECAGELSNHFTLGGLVEAGCGITVLPRLAYPVIAHPGTVAIDVPDTNFVRALGVATRRDYKPSPAAEAFIASMIPLVKELLRRKGTPNPRG